MLEKSAEMVNEESTEWLEWKEFQPRSVKTTSKETEENLQLQHGSEICLLVEHHYLIYITVEDTDLEALSSGIWALTSVIMAKLTMPWKDSLKAALLGKKEKHIELSLSAACTQVRWRAFTSCQSLTRA